MYSTGSWYDHLRCPDRCSESDCSMEFSSWLAEVPRTYMKYKYDTNSMNMKHRAEVQYQGKV